MTIHFYDGGYADCSEIEVIGDQIYWDGCRYFPLVDVEWIEDDDGSDITYEYLGGVYGSTDCSEHYVKASEELSSEYMTPEQVEIVDKINASNPTIARALTTAYKQAAELSLAGKPFAEGQISGIAFAVWQMSIINFSEYCILSGI